MELARELLNGDPHCFHGSTSHFDSVRRYLADALGVGKDAVVLVGSGQNGFSLAPTNNLRPFHPDSDLDFAIVSSSLFDEYWKLFAHWAHPRRHRLPAKEAKWFKTQSDGIFWGWLQPDRLQPPSYLKWAHELHRLRDLRTQWFTTFKRISLELPDVPQARRDCSARLYRDEWHLLEYQAESIRRLAKAMQKESE